MEAGAAMPNDQRIGPGRLVLVIGPSGAGKDTLIAWARDRCRNDPTIVFPLRIVTRPASSAEDHATVSADEFERVLASGGFSLWCRAHGHSYALPRAIDAERRCRPDGRMQRIPHRDRDRAGPCMLGFRSSSSRRRLTFWRSVWRSAAVNPRRLSPIGCAARNSWMRAGNPIW